MTDPSENERRAPGEARSRTAHELGLDADRARDELRREADAQADATQQRVAGGTDTLAAGAHAAADRLAADDHMLTGHVREAADALGGLAQRLQGQSTEQTLRDVEDFGRRNPALFMGLAVALGIGLGRLSRARPPESRHRAHAEGDYR